MRPGTFPASLGEYKVVAAPSNWRFSRHEAFAVRLSAKDGNRGGSSRRLVVLGDFLPSNRFGPGQLASYLGGFDGSAATRRRRPAAGTGAGSC